MIGELIQKRSITRLASNTPPRLEDDQVAIEEPLEIRVDTRPIAVTMRTPGHDRELAVGFLVSEGIIRAPTDLLAKGSEHDAANVVQMFLAPHVVIDFSRLTRHVFASSSCGLCGKATIEAIRGQFDSIQCEARVPAKILDDLPRQLRSVQSAFNQSGGIHAAALFDFAGKLLIVREDVGRHNAVDKLLGWALQRGRLPLDECILLVSGRASFEIVQKALAGRIPIVAAVSAPSSLAVDFANENGQTLIGFLRDGRMNIYAGPKRIVN